MAWDAAHDRLDREREVEAGDGVVVGEDAVSTE